MRQHVIAGHRQFECPDEWFEYLSPYFEGARYARRTGRFTVTAHFKQLPRYSLHDVSVCRSGLAPGKHGVFADGIERHRYFAIWQATGTSTVEQARCFTSLAAGHFPRSNVQRSFEVSRARIAFYLSPGAVTISPMNS